MLDILSQHFFKLGACESGAPAELPMVMEGGETWKPLEANFSSQLHPEQLCFHISYIEILYNFTFPL